MDAWSPLHGLTSIEPLIVVSDGVYGVASQCRGDAALVSAMGVRHGLRRLASPRQWGEHASRLSKEALERVISREVASLGGSGDALPFFLSVLFPNLAARDWGESAGTVREAPASGETVADADHRLASAPPPLPSPPALLLLDRVWRLEESPTPGAVLHVEIDGHRFVPSGEYESATQLEAAWQLKLEQCGKAVAEQLVSRRQRLPPALLADARDQIAGSGAVRRGALLFIPTEPPRVGHVVPPHFNRSLGRSVDDDVAITLPLVAGRGVFGQGELVVYARQAGRWREISLPRGICLGAGAPAHPAGAAGELAAVAYLRWAATRVAANELFHEHDGSYDE